ncbi:MAG: glycosyltransferase family 4 protein [Planctomycetota bacterium]|jgi:glycosyltransferase involved in cell wall biosynthesis
MADPVARIWGDPLVDDERGREIRAMIQAIPASELRLELCWTGVRGSETGSPVRVGDGDAGEIEYRSPLPAKELEGLLARMQGPVPASSPLLVFADGDSILQASLEFPRAVAVIDARQSSPEHLLRQVKAGLLQSLESTPEFALPPLLAKACLRVPDWSAEDRGVLHFAGAGEDPGSERILEALSSCPAAMHVRFVLCGATAERQEYWSNRLAELPASQTWELLEGELRPEHFQGCRALIQPDADFRGWQAWVMAMAAGRVLIASRYAESARLLRAPGLCLPLGGRVCEGAFTPNPRALRLALENVLASDESTFASMQAIGRRARHWYRSQLCPQHSRPTGSSPRNRRKPLLVLEAPLFERSSSSILTLETASALQRSGRVDLGLVASLPFKADLASLRAAYPTLLSCLSRDPGPADLWLRSGWPVAAQRPDANCFALRLDWEYGAIPSELSPVVTQEADRVIVHSRAVQRAVLAAGSEPGRVLRIPHGVDGEVFNEKDPAMPEILGFKGQRPAVLFVGELIWRKGFDIWLKLLLSAHARGMPVCAVVKTPGGGSKYAGYQMRELLERCTRDAPGLEIMVVEDNLEPGEMAALYRACDLLLHPYRGEGFCLPVLEASACGLPVLTTAGGSTDDFTDPSLGIPAARRFVELAGAHEGRPFVLEPDASKSVELFIDRLARIGEYRAKAEAAAGSQRRIHTWDRAAACLENLAFQAMAGAPLNTGSVCEIPMPTSSQGHVVDLPKDPMPQLLRG